MDTRSEPVSPTISFCGSTSSRYSWNPYSGGNHVHQWIQQSTGVKSTTSPMSLPLSDIPSGEGGRPRELSDALSLSQSEASTPRRRENSSFASSSLANNSKRCCPESIDGVNRYNHHHHTRSGIVEKSSEGLCTTKVTDTEALEAITRLRRVKRDENVPNQFRRYNRGMQKRIISAIARDEGLLLDLCESERGNIVITAVQVFATGASAPSPSSADGEGTTVRHSHKCGGSEASSSSQVLRSSPPDLMVEPGVDTSRSSRTPKHKSVLGELLCSESTSDAECLLSTLMQHCWRLCTHQGGCIAVSRLFDVMPERQRQILEDFVVDNFLALAVHPYGNYVVQKVLRSQSSDDGVLKSVLIHVSVASSVVALASNKFGSHVLEAFFCQASPLLCCLALHRLMSDSDTVHFLVCDKFGNYVIQQAMRRITNAVSERRSPQHQRSGDQQPSSMIGLGELAQNCNMLPSPNVPSGTATAMIDEISQSDIGEMRERFIALLAPHLEASTFGHNISKSFSLRGAVSPHSIQ